MTKKSKINSILEKVLERICVPEEDIKKINDSLRDFLKKLSMEIKKKKISAEVFVGGSLAKRTMINKGSYDVDIFIRFDRKYKDSELSELTKKILIAARPKRESKDILRVHGSRDYFCIKVTDKITLELIPVKKIRNPKEAENITDLSYSHVRYIKKSFKSNRKKLLDDVMLAKAFCYANKCYGAESYIKGFSGYGLELLVYHYKGFLKFLRAISKRDSKIVIDIEKQYKNKNQVLMDINAAKLQSPIILVDPTYKQRNVLAGLSEETLKKFQKKTKKFLKNPSIKEFELKKLDLEETKKNAKRKKYEFISLEAKTSKQKGDIAGSKLLKFYNHLGDEAKKYFEIKSRDFEYDEKYKKGKTARFFFVVKKKKEILIKGPSLKQKEHVKKFKAKNKSTFIRRGRIYSKNKINFTLKKFIKDWKIKNKRQMKEMRINELLVKN